MLLIESIDLQNYFCKIKINIHIIPLCLVVLADVVLIHILGKCFWETLKTNHFFFKRGQKQ